MTDHAIVAEQDTDMTDTKLADPEPVTAAEIEAGDHILVRDHGETLTARVTGLARYHDGSGNRRTFRWQSAGGAGEITCADTDLLTRVPAPPPPGRPEVSEVTITRRMAISSLAVTAECLGLPLPDRLFIPVTEPDEAAAVIIGRAREQCRSHGVRFTAIDDETRFGLEIDVGGAVYRMIHTRDDVVRRHATAPVPAAA
jgi:hypothetical protein